MLGSGSVNVVWVGSITGYVIVWLLAKVLLEIVLW